jgi:hypothetical protein
VRCAPPGVMEAFDRAREALLRARELPTARRSADARVSAQGTMP